ncbi:lipid-A-disaccharide synthase [Fulvivirga kasyanovii]|uniref:Lipid-A-disaccharide synthase n=1 Tax=Fulvivirga kasyanovii TaxID=396812 RepID=A0ABW9RLY2_9BACT|nr:lipid-A-disaccharide synthase [Fulvivirga kasyanovii]MTI24701.1 lipid-A-disaccharide synthase [Fulvivirga kasyanovii]
MKYFVIAGERSGDLHAGNLIKALKGQDPQASVKGFGGDYMETAGAEILVHYRELAFMGFLEVVKNLGTIRRYLAYCKREIDKFKPDVVVLVDYAGFNLKIAKYAKGKGIPVYYYISPKVWAWNQKRALKIKRRVDHMFVIMPFEQEFYKKYDWPVDYVGNPVLDAVNDYHPDIERTELEGDYIAVLPGSRKQELQNVLPTINGLVKLFPDQQFAVAAVDNLSHDLYSSISSNSNVKLVYGYTYDLLAHARAAIVTSGTATLETAMWEVPQIVIYKTSGISYKIAKWLIKVPFISLVNLIANKEVVKELIQDDLNEKSLSEELSKILNDQPYREEMLNQYQMIKKQLDIGRASDNAAELMVKYLRDAG